MKKRILFLTDSLSLSRDNPEVVKYEDTYVYLLKSNYPEYDIIQCGYGGATINILLEQASYLKMMKPDIIILQSGIVDCAPRSITKFESDIITRIPILSKHIFQFIRKYSPKIRKIRSITYSSKNNFKKSILELKKIFPHSDFYCFGILLANSNYEVKVPGITLNIKMYNQILKSIFNEKYIDTSNINTKCIMSDNIHLNKEGHKIIFSLLKNIFSL